jgi:hypothetical protein
MTFHTDNQPLHDRAAAGRKGKLRSPWNAAKPTPRLARLHDIRRAVERIRSAGK